MRADPAIEFDGFSLFEGEGEINPVGDRAIVQVGCQLDLIENAAGGKALNIDDDRLALSQFGENDLHASAVTASRQDRDLRQEPSARPFADRARTIGKRPLRAAAELQTKSMRLPARLGRFALAPRCRSGSVGGKVGSPGSGCTLCVL